MMLRKLVSGIITGLVPNGSLLEVPVRRISLASRSLLAPLPSMAASSNMLSRCSDQRIMHIGHSRRTFYGIAAAVNPAPTSALLRPSSQLEVPMRMKSKKGKIYIPALRPNPLRQLRTGGYAARMSTTAGRHILMRRILKGCKYLHN